MRAARAVLTLPIAPPKHAKAAVPSAPSAVDTARLALAQDDASRASDASLRGLPPVELILLIECLRGSLSDLLRLHHGGPHHWARLRQAEAVNLATMNVTDLRAMARQLRDEVAELAV